MLTLLLQQCATFLPKFNKANPCRALEHFEVAKLGSQLTFRANKTLSS